MSRTRLSFGDTLNILLFVLTFASLFLAYQGVQLARVTLDDARSQAAKAARDQDAQFQEQMNQLRISSRNLENVTKLLSNQSELLRDLQNVSRQQLRDLNNAEARIRNEERARPTPHISGLCEHSAPFIDVQIKSTRPDPVIPSGITLHQHRGGIHCLIWLSNDGEAELKNTTFEIQLQDPWTSDHSCSPDTFIAQVNHFPLGLGVSKSLLAGVTILPRFRSDKRFETDLDIKLSQECRFFHITLTLESDQIERVEIPIYVVVLPVGP